MTVVLSVAIMSHLLHKVHEHHGSSDSALLRELID